MNLSQEDKNKLYSIFHNFEKKIDDVHKNWKEKTNSNILIVDGNNLFIRSFEATTYLNNNGEHTGGVVASLKSLGYAIKLLCPTRCVVIFDGVGGSFKRKQIYPEYKSHKSSKIRLNRAYEELSDPKTEEESRTKQYLRFINYLQVLPVNIMSLNSVEADDLIAYLATDYFKESNKVTIMSSDKDFLQLCNNKVHVYSPTKKRIYGVEQVINEYNIHPNNFVLFRALDGDPSDNVPGIEGAGPKTIVKHFPFLKEEILYTVDEIISRAINVRNKYKVCENISNGKQILDRNVSLMQLKETALTTTSQLYCNEVLDTSKIPRLDRNAFFKMIKDDSMSNNFPNYVDWISQVFDSLDRVTRYE
jgi:DNA polymerase-1